jgi:hypothetical protein
MTGTSLLAGFAITLVAAVIATRVAEKKNRSGIWAFWCCVLSPLVLLILLCLPPLPAPPKDEVLG